MTWTVTYLTTDRPADRTPIRTVAGQFETDDPDPLTVAPKPEPGSWLVADSGRTVIHYTPAPAQEDRDWKQMYRVER